MTTFNLGPQALVEIQSFQNKLMRYPRAQRATMIRYLSTSLGLSVKVTSPAATPAKRKAIVRKKVKASAHATR